MATQNRRVSVGRMNARTQSTSQAPAMQFVTVAVLPRRLPPGMAPPTGLSMADCFGWDENVNWRHNLPIEQIKAQGQKQKRRQSSLKKTFTTDRAGRNPDTPPSIFRQVPYHTWRRHYAKDKDGNYRGTHAPAEDCLLLPHDVERWRLGEPTTFADRFTRGKEALPAYGEEHEFGLPTYVPDKDEDLDRQRRREEEALRKSNEEAMQINKRKKDGWRKKVQRGLEMASFN